MTRVRLSSCVPRAWTRLVAVAVQEQRLAIDGARMRAGASLAQAKASWGDPGPVSPAPEAPRVVMPIPGPGIGVGLAGDEGLGGDLDLRRALYWDRWA